MLRALSSLAAAAIVLLLAPQASAEQQRIEIASEPLTEKQVFDGPSKVADAEAYNSVVVKRYGLAPVPPELVAQAQAVRRTILSAALSDGSCDVTVGRCQSKEAVGLCVERPDAQTFGQSVRCVAIAGARSPTGSSGALNIVGMRARRDSAEAFIAVSVQRGENAPIEYNLWRADLEQANGGWVIGALWYMHNGDQQRIAAPPPQFRHGY